MRTLLSTAITFLIVVKNYGEAFMKVLCCCRSFFDFFYFVPNFLSMIVGVNKFLFITCPNLFQTSIISSLLKIASLSQIFDTKVMCECCAKCPIWMVLFKQYFLMFDLGQKMSLESFHFLSLVFCRIEYFSLRWNRFISKNSNHHTYVIKYSENLAHNILDLFKISAKFSFTTRKMVPDT